MKKIDNIPPAKDEHSWCVGKRSCEELVLHKPHRIQELYITRDSILDSVLKTKIKEGNISLTNLDKDEFLALDPSFESLNHQWICARLTTAAPLPYQQIFDRVLKEEAPLIIILDQVQDPQNLGAIFRVCECGGASALMMTEKRSAHVTPLVRKISAGATEFVPFSVLTNLAQVINYAKKKGFWVYGASLSEGSEELYRAKVHQPTVLIMGSEHTGLRKQTETLCDQLLNIPQYGLLQSMNVVSSTAVLLFELQRRVRYENSSK